MVPQKRILVAAAGAVAAILALTACGSGDYGLSSSAAAQLGVGASASAAADEDAVGDSAGIDVDEGDGAADADPEATEPAEQALAKPAGNVTKALVAKAVPRMGNVVTDAKGWILYRFDKDKASPSKSNCVGDCAKLWPPVLAGQTLELSGISTREIDTIERPDGGQQVTIGGWPVYRYIGDKKVGQWKGQNVGGTWFVVSKDGKKNLTCVPPVSKAVKLPVSESDDSAADSADEGAADNYDSGY